VQVTRQAPAAEASPQQMLESITRMAETFKATVAETQAAIGDSARSEERGAAALDRMLAAAREAGELVSENSDIWRQINQTLTVWQRNQREAEDKAMTDSTYRELADSWGGRIRQVNELRSQILRERGRTMATLDGIEAQRGRIIEWYKLGDADRALAGLRQIGNQLTEFNNNLDAMVASAQRLQRPGVAN